MNITRASKEPPGAALVVVLAVVLLLTGLVVAFLSQAMLHHRISSQSAGLTKADLLARSALSIIVGDLKREILLGSDPDATASPVFYIPKTTAGILPQRNFNPSGSPDPIPNLVRRSIRNDPSTVPSRASAVNSTDDISVNSRSIALARWNAHYLIPKLHAIGDASDPVADFTAPDWVIVTRSGVTVKRDEEVASMRDPTNPDHAFGRYAYAIYDEGGLLDLNVAGFDSSLGLSATLTAAKGSLAFADLTCLPGLDRTESLNDLLGWRNFATLKASGDFGLHNFTFAAAASYSDFVLNNPGCFLKITSSPWRNLTDQMFVNRQALISFRQSLGFSTNSLPFLGTFSRDLNLPTLPSVLKLRVRKSFTRRDGDRSAAGESLVRRFSLERLNELNKFPPADPAGVQRDFGLVAMAGTGDQPAWGYCGVTGTSLKSVLDQSWMTTGGREPDFFELIALGSGPNPALPDVLATGARIIDQFDSDTENIRIGYLNGSTVMVNGTDTPAFLNRPFQSVGEMRYAEGTTDEMLDLFCARNSEEKARLHAGVINRNTRNTTTISAVLAGAYTNRSTPEQGLSAGSALAAAKKLTQTAQSRGEGLGNITATGTDTVLVSRALADVSTTRVWNLMIDVIAQSGRFTPGATHLNQFVVDGESRYWLHIALDRFTGRILDIQSEAVHE